MMREEYIAALKADPAFRFIEPSGTGFIIVLRPIWSFVVHLQLITSRYTTQR